MASYLAPPRRWEAELRILPSSRVAVRLVSEERSDLTVCSSPSEAIRVLEEFLRPFRCWYDEFVVWSRTELGPPHMWTTRSPAGGLYWCTTILGKIWPPPWVPLVERRGTCRFVGEPAFEPPLVDRRAASRRGTRADRITAH
jgi:hypothetical protein